MEGFLFTIVLIVFGLWCLLKWMSAEYDYFKKQDIKFVKPYPFIGNNTFLFGKLNFPEYVKNMYLSFPNERVFGLFNFGQPFYVIRDPTLLKHIAVKEFDNFPDHRTPVDPKDDPIMGSMLFTMQGKKWRDMRSSLSPAFTGSKMRLMFELVSVCGEQMSKTLKSSVYDMKDLYTKFTNDVIATCAFGIKCDSFDNPENDFFKIGQNMLNKPTVILFLKLLLIKIFPKLMKLIGVSILGKKSKEKFYGMIVDTMEMREKNKIIRPDMIQLLMELRKGELKSNDEKEVNDSIAGTDKIDSKINQHKVQWTDDEIIAQCVIFFFAGFETSSTLMSFLSYELAIHPEIQNKLIEEIDEIRKELDGKPLTYETLHSLKYLDMVVAETLRKWPSSAFTDRVCGKDFTYEDENCLKFKIKKDMGILIPIYGLHMDPKYFPEPDKFDPERFSEENKQNINFNAYLPFGIGPRNCIGSRFALMEVKIAIFHLLSNFTLEVCDQTQIPLKMGSTMNGFKPEKGIKLEMKSRNFLILRENNFLK